MRSTIPLVCCSIICSVFLLSSCTKNADQPAIPSNIAAGNQASYTADLVAPGDSTVLRGDTANGDQTALIQSRKSPYLRDNNYGNFPAYNGLVWTWSGVPGADRSLMKFSLARVPKKYRDNPPAIKKVLLYLYQYQRNDGLDIYGVNQTVSNAVELHRIVSYWTSSTVTWNNQPVLASGSANPMEDVITIPPIATPLPRHAKDDIVIDVTAMVQRMAADGANRGFLLKIPNQDEMHPYCGRSFGSFACPDQSKKPKLVIYY